MNRALEKVKIGNFQLEKHEIIELPEIENQRHAFYTLLTFSTALYRKKFDNN